MPTRKRPSRAEPDPPVADRAVEPFERFADAVLARAVVRARELATGAPNPLAGLVVHHEEIGGLLAALPGSEGGPHAAPRPTSDDQGRWVADSTAAFHASLRAGGPFAAVCEAVQLPLEDAEVFAVLTAVELDGRRQRLVGYLQDDANRRRVELGTLAVLFDSGRRAPLALSDGAPLVRSALVGVEDSGPWSSRAVSVEPSVVWAFLEDGSPDPDLPLTLEVRHAAEGQGSGHMLTTVVGADRVRRLEVAVRETAGTTFLACGEPAEEREWRALVREATLASLGLILEVEGTLSPTGRRWIDRTPHVSWCLSSRTELPIRDLPWRPHLEFEALGGRATAEEVERALEQPDTGHSLTADQLERVVRVLPAVGGDIDAAVRRLASGQLEQLSDRVRPERTWADLVLADDETAQLRHLASRYRKRRSVREQWGFADRDTAGLVALFAGPSGTGKTLAAEVLAGDLGLHMYRLELSALMSKWVGETEKNLEEVFDAAEAGDVLLLFDEADAVFGKRGQVTDARDRYANLSTSYLLQRLDQHSGVVVLTTNLRQNLDEAFTRRIHTSIDFRLPAAPERLRLWEQAFGPNIATSGLDLAELAQRHELSGGSIHRVALAAAFIAADTDGAIEAAHVEAAIQREYEKLQRLPG